MGRGRTEGRKVRACAPAKVGYHGYFERNLAVARTVTFSHLPTFGLHENGRFSTFRSSLEIVLKRAALA